MLPVNLHSQITEGERLLGRSWKVVASPGVLAIVVGVVLLVWPEVTALIGLFGAFALVAGLRTVMIGAFTGPVRAGRRGWVVVEGVLGVAVGVLVFVRPGLSTLALLYGIAAWVIAAGMLELVAAFAPPFGGGRSLLLVLAHRVRRHSA